MTNAFASGRSDSEAGSESLDPTVDRADRGLSAAAAGSGRTIKDKYSMSTGSASCWSLASSAARQPGRLGSCCEWPYVKLCPRDKPCCYSKSHSRAVVCHSPSLVKGIVVKGRRLHWLYWLTRSSGSGSIRGERRFDPRRPTAGRHCLAIRRASGGGRRDRRATVTGQ